MISNTFTHGKLVGNKLRFVLLYNFYLKYFPLEILTDYTADALREMYGFSGESPLFHPDFKQALSSSAIKIMTSHSGFFDLLNTERRAELF